MVTAKVPITKRANSRLRNGSLRIVCVKTSYKESKVKVETEKSETEKT